MELRGSSWTAEKLQSDLDEIVAELLETYNPFMMTGDELVHAVVNGLGERGRTVQEAEFKDGTISVKLTPTVEYVQISLVKDDNGDSSNPDR